LTSRGEKPPRPWAPDESARRTIEADYRARTARSAALFAEAQGVFPGGVTRSVSYFAPYPVHLASGLGCHAVDVDGHRYLDCLNNFGSLIHGHGHPGISRAVAEQAARGTDFGTPTELHLALARALQARMPSLERLRFTTSGTEAVLYAVRAARAFTRRTKILKFEGSYHGGYDSVSVSVDPGPDAPEPPRGRVGSAGLPPEVADHTLVAPYNDLESATAIIHQHRDALAALIVEPVTVRGMIPAAPGFLAGLRDAARAAGALFILDEVVTFRLAVGGAQALAGVTPDLTTLGKIIGGGLPVGAFGGRADVMEAFTPGRPNQAHHSGTFAGNAAVMAAGMAALGAYDAAAIDRLNALGESLRIALRAAFRAAGVAAQVTGEGSLAGIHFTAGSVRDYRSALASDREAHRWLHLALLNRGVFTRSGMSLFLSTAMGGADVDTAVAAVQSALG
jgi:glutamate-1-semialdehyde 2,1-aminomutase